MKKIFIVRHAKSSRDPEYLIDFDRPIIQKGMERATRISKKLKDTGEIPWVILSSSARRAKETANIFSENLGGVKIVLRDELYSNPNAIFEIMSGMEYHDCDSIMIVGHNPDMEDFIYEITGLNVEMTTSSVCLIESETGDWKNMNKTNSFIKLHFWGDGDEEEEIQPDMSE